METWSSSSQTSPLLKSRIEIDKCQAVAAKLLDFCVLDWQEDFGGLGNTVTEVAWGQWEQERCRTCRYDAQTASCDAGNPKFGMGAESGHKFNTNARGGLRNNSANTANTFSALFDVCHTIHSSAPQQRHLAESLPWIPEVFSKLIFSCRPAL
jgi:hypothetical protein